MMRTPAVPPRKRPPWLVLGVAAVLSALLVVGPWRPARAPLPPPTLVGDCYVIDHDVERTLLGGRNRPGRLVDVAPGDASVGVTVTVHGINSSPADIQCVSTRAAASGGLVKTFAYDASYRRLRDSSEDLARELTLWRRGAPRVPLTLLSHSMGGRVVLGAMAVLQESGFLADGVPVRLTLIAPPLGGYAYANRARRIPHLFDGVFSGLSPGRDMGTNSGFQKGLERLFLPPQVTTTIIVGDHDVTVDSTLPGFVRIAGNLHATIIHVPGADHLSVLAQAPL